MNLAIWVDYRLRGTWGALGIVVLPATVAVIIATELASLSRFAVAYLVLGDVGAAAIGLSLSMGLIAGRRACRGVVPVAIMALAFVGVGLFDLPMPLVVLVLSPVSVGIAYLRLPPR